MTRYLTLSLLVVNDPLLLRPTAFLRVCNEVGGNPQTEAQQSLLNTPAASQQTITEILYSTGDTPTNRPGKDQAGGLWSFKPESFVQTLMEEFIKALTTTEGHRRALDKFPVGAESRGDLLEF